MQTIYTTRLFRIFYATDWNMTSSDNIRCIREYTKKDGTKTYHAEERFTESMGIIRIALDFTERY